MTISILTPRFGPNNKQLDRFEDLLSKKFNSKEDLILHGGDIGDDLTHRKAELQGFKIEIYPCNRSDAGNNFRGITIHSEMRLDERNKKLVELADTMIVLPQYMNAWEDSPLWKTTRAAVASGKEIFLISQEGYCYNLWR